MNTRRSYPWILAGAVLTAAALLWAAGRAQGQPPKAIPTPTYTVTAAYTSKDDTMTVVQTVKPNNLPATAKSWWITTVVPIVHVVFEGGEMYVFPWQGGPPPPVPPVPPIPPVPPVPVPAELWCIVIEESAERTPQQGIVLASPKVRALFPAAGGFRLVDKDSKVDNALQPYLDRAKGQKLPITFLVDPKGQVYYEGTLPATVDAMTALVDKIKKGGAK